MQKFPPLKICCNIFWYVKRKIPFPQGICMIYPDSEALEADKEADKAGHCFSG